MGSDESSIISKLESSTDLTGIHRLVTSHLQPFDPFLNPPSTTSKKPSKPPKSKPTDNTPTIRSLAKQFLPFLNKSLSIIPKRLSESPKIPQNNALHLFDVYRLCLKCIGLITPVLEGKPHAVEVQRLRYLHCLESWELYSEAEAEGLYLLGVFKESVKGVSKGKSRELENRLVPELDPKGAGQEIGRLILEIVVTLVKCGSKRRSKMDADYWRIISLVKESEEWFKALDPKDYDKYHRFLVTNLHITAQFLIADVKCFDLDLIREFFSITFKEYKRSSLLSQMYKLPLKACSSLFSQRDELSNEIIVVVLKYLLAPEWKAGLQETSLGFLELVCYCANKCHRATMNLCGPVAEHLSKLADAFRVDFPLISSILMLYGAGLLASSSKNQLHCESTENWGHTSLGLALCLWLDKIELHQPLSSSLESMIGYSEFGCNEKKSLENGMSQARFNWDALKFFTQSLAESIYSDRKYILSETESSFQCEDLSKICEVFHHFSNIFLQHLSATERDRETSGDNYRVISSVAVAALILSLQTKQKVKVSTRLIKEVILTDWIPVKRLKYLYVALNNIAVILNRQKQLTEAIKALKLSCKATWKHLVYLCEMHVEKSHVSHEDVSEKTITDLVKEASERTAFLLELNREGGSNINSVIVDSLECWSNAEKLICGLSTPASFIKKFVKIESLLSKNVDGEHARTLYSLLQSSMKSSKRSLGRLLEQELCSYKESHLNLKFRIRMQIKIIDILLEDIYNTEESNFEKSRILIEKAKVLRAHGLERVKECMQCLEAATSTLELLKRSSRAQAHHLLIHAYLMRALCTMDSMSSSIDLSQKSGFLQDIQTAVRLCLSAVQMHADDEGEDSEDMLYLWYQLIDFLSIKGYLELHPSLYNVVIKLFGQKNFSLEKAVSGLWKNRRFSHGLCASPINHKFIKTFSEHQIQTNSTEFWGKCMEELNPTVAGFHQTDDKLKQAASELGSKGSLSSSAIFFSSQLFYDLSGRLISRGSMVEALSYAKEAHRLRSILLQQKFVYSVEKVTETFDEGGKIIEKSYYAIQTFKVKDVISNESFSSYEGCSLTPWNVLSCYLESLLQVGVIQEILGSASESEMLLRCGRNISQFQGLPLFEISFSSMLGKLYRKQKLRCIAEKELRSAEKILTDNSEIISCERCACMLEISINHQIGELLLSNSCSSGESPSAKRLSDAGSLYRSALHKLNLSKLWVFISDEATSDQLISRESSTGSCASNLPDSNRSISTRPRRTKKEVKPATQRQDMVSCQSRRITRSSHRSLMETLESAPSDRQSAPSVGLVNEHLSNSAAGLAHIVSDSEAKMSATDFQSGITSLCNKMKCWHCVYNEATCTSSINNFIHMHWELVYRKISLRLLVGIGKLSSIYGDYHETQKLLLQSISVLLSRNSVCSEYSSSSLMCLIETIGKHFPGDVLAAERAALIYYICWFILKGYPYQGTRDICREISSIGTPQIFSLLKLAFVLSQEVPSLNQKISRLLAVLYVLSSSMKSFTLTPSEEGLESQWASFFHQASLGTHLVQQIYSDLLYKGQDSVASDSEGCLLENSISRITEKLGSLRLASESSKCLNAFVQRFFNGLPSTPVICISLVVGVDAGLLSDLLQCSPTIQAWILLSHLRSDDQHVVLLPLHEIIKEVLEDEANSSLINLDYKSDKQWNCPWVSCVIDEVAPLFRHLLEGNYHSSTDHYLEHIKGNTSLWWSQRKRLDKCLGTFLQDVEDLWLGAWKYLLLGEWPDHNYLDSVRKNLFGGETHPLKHVLSKKCYVGLRPDVSSDSSGEFDSTIQFLYKRTLKKSHSHEQGECVSTKPIILVLDFEVQMLPWENLPILRNQEVYRMPSVGSICLTIDRCCEKGERNANSIQAIPLIDPLDSYYLLNPDGDLHKTQVAFEDWFKIQNIKGKTGTVPTIEELSLALKNHDLFIYFGHGSGTQYIPEYEIEKLDNCAATLLLGCSSGCLHLKGCYIPHGAPISYLLAGSPVIVANLWEVTDKDIDRFGKAMLSSWLREREAASSECSECDVRTNNCIHRQRIGSFMSQARDACNLTYLIGAAPVCYGVPTGIVNKKKVRSAIL